MSPEQAAPIRALQQNIERVFYGKPEVIKSLLVAVFSGGHVLIEDVPGIGKTLLAKALARSLDCIFQRIQFTSDLLPSDVTGVSVYDPGAKQFVFKPGPIFANVLLADEINRTSPRTQSALLEGMNDFQISADGVSHPLPKPFIVLATQNPFEFEGTYPLPESELDRFFIRLSIGYPPRQDEMRILRDHVTMESVDKLAPVMSVRQVLDLQAAVGRVRMDGSISEYILQLVERTRQASGVDVGISPRGSLALYRGVQALAMIEGRDYVLPDDVKQLCRPVFLHRLVCRGSSDRSVNGHAARILDGILDSVSVPV